MLGGPSRGGYVAVVILFVLAVALFGGAALFLFKGPPALAGPIATRLPPAIALALGDKAMHDDIYARLPCRNPTAEAALAAILYRLTGHLERPPLLKLRVVEVHAHAFAYAAPGGHIVLAKRLFDLAEHPDEIAGVIAHMLGHVMERHPLAGLVRQLGPEGALHYLRGDINAMREAMAELTAITPRLAFGPAEEAEAEQIAAALLKAAGIDPQAASRFFSRIGAGQPRDYGIGRFVASHPGIAARVATLAVPRPALNDVQWRQLRRICD